MKAIGLAVVFAILVPSAASATDAAHPATCPVIMSDGAIHDLPWEAAGCTSARAEWEKTKTVAPRPTAYPAEKPGRIQPAIKIKKLFTVMDSNWWTSCVTFENTTNRDISSIQFEFAAFDDFNEKVGRFHGDRRGDFSPGVVIEGPDNASDFGTTGNRQKAMNCWHSTTILGSVSRIEASVGKIRFSDGELVTSPMPPESFSWVVDIRRQ